MAINRRKRGGGAGGKRGGDRDHRRGTFDRWARVESAARFYGKLEENKEQHGAVRVIMKDGKLVT